jgi:hypothetical protein
MTSSSVCLPAVASPKMDWLLGSIASCVSVGGRTANFRDGRSDGLSRALLAPEVSEPSREAVGGKELFIFRGGRPLGRFGTTAVNGLDRPLR